MQKKWFLAVGVLLWTSGTAMADNYGAIAYDRARDHWGHAYDFSTQRQADAVAMHYCGANCKLVVEFVNDCAAFAVGPGTSIGWAHYMNELVAERAALAQCNKLGGPCQLKEMVCNTPYRSSGSGSGSPFVPNFPERSILSPCMTVGGGRVPGCHSGE